MKKKIIGFVLVLCAVMSLALCVHAAEIMDSGECGAQGDNVTWTLDSEGTLIVNGEGEMSGWQYWSPQYVKSIIIGDGVTDFSTYFSRCENLDSIQIGNGVTSIASGAFKNCKKLQTVHIGDSVTDIGNEAFRDCENLDTVNFSRNILKIGDWAFYGCCNLPEIILPNSVQKIGKFAFSGCKKLESITLGENITSIGENAFNGTAYYYNEANWENSKKYSALYIDKYLIKTSELLESIYSIKLGTEVIADRAFQDSNQLSMLEIPNSVTHIGSDCFQFIHFQFIGLAEIFYTDSETEWNNIVNNTNISENVIMHYNKKIDLSASGMCGENLLWSLDNSILTISGTGNMNDCSYSYELPWYTRRDVIETVIIDDGVMSISNNAFSACSNLSKVNIPQSITSIGERIVGSSDIIVDENNLNYTSIDGVLFDKAAEVLITFPNKNIETYIVPDGVKRIESRAFAYTDVKNILLPEGLLEIKGGAFYSCNVNNLYIPKSVEIIGNNVFFNMYQTLKIVFYGGSEEKWNEIQKGYDQLGILSGAYKYWNATGINSPQIGNLILGSSVSEGITDLIKVSLTNTEYDSEMITVFYKNGSLVDMQTTPIKSGDEMKDIPIPENCGADKAKVFIWSSLDSMKPLCESKEIKLTEEDI